MSSDHDTDPPKKRPSLRRLGTISKSGRWIPLESPRYSPALRAIDSEELEELVGEREQLREQLRHVRDLSTRLIDKVDAQDQRLEVQRRRIETLEAELKQKDTLIHDLEAEVAEMIAHASNREDHVRVLKVELQELSSANDELALQATKREERISQLESFLAMIADADRREK